MTVRAAPAPALALAVILIGCRASDPGKTETKVSTEIKQKAIGGKDWKNPVPFTEKAAKTGAEHFRHHCAICHGNDGHRTGVAYAERMSPPVPDLGDQRIQEYTDGQLKWIIDNGIRYSGMPRWQGIIGDADAWNIVHYIRHLPAQGSAGVPACLEEAGQAHMHKHQKHR